MATLSIDLGGFIPQTIEQLREIAKDRDFRNKHEAQQAKLEEEKSATELERMRLENEAKEIENRQRALELEGQRFKLVIDFIKQIAPGEPPEVHALLAAQIFPDLKSLITPRVTITFEEPEQR